MPFYEYRCLACQRKYTRLVGVAAEKSSPKCPHCESRKAVKLISRFRRLRSEEEAIERLADPSAIGDLKDPQALRRWAKRLGKEMGEDLGDEFDQMLEEEMAKESRKPQDAQEASGGEAPAEPAEEGAEDID